MPKNLIYTKSKKLNLRKGWHHGTHKLANKIYKLVEGYDAENKKFNLRTLMVDLGYDSSKMIYDKYNAMKSKVYNIIVDCRKRIDALLKASCDISLVDGILQFRFRDLETGEVLTEEGSDIYLDTIRKRYGFPNIWRDDKKKTFVSVATFKRKEFIDNQRLLKHTLALEGVVEEMTHANEKIFLTNKRAIDVRLPLKDMHQNLLIDGVDVDIKPKNIWEEIKEKDGSIKDINAPISKPVIIETEFSEN